MHDVCFEEKKYHSIFSDMSKDSIEDVLIVSDDLIYDQTCESNRDYFSSSLHQLTLYEVVRELIGFGVFAVSEGQKIAYNPSKYPANYFVVKTSKNKIAGMVKDHFDSK